MKKQIFTILTTFCLILSLVFTGCSGTKENDNIGKKTTKNDKPKDEDGYEPTTYEISNPNHNAKEKPRDAIEYVFEPVKSDISEDELDYTEDLIQKRAKELEIEITTYVDYEKKRISIMIPVSLKDKEETVRKLTSPGNIYFIYGQGHDGIANIVCDYNCTSGYRLSRSITEIIDSGNVIIDGSDIKSVSPKIRQDPYMGLMYYLELSFNESGSNRFASATSYAVNAGSHLENIIAIVYDNDIISAPGVSGIISNGSVVINGQNSYEESRELAAIIKYGALPIELALLRIQS